MNLTFIANACCVFEQRGFKILCDPWLVDGAFEGAWFHFPPLRTTAADLLGVDCLYVSHLHPDHFDAETLKVFAAQRPDIDVVVLDHGNNHLHRLLRQLELTRVAGCRDGASIRRGPFELTFHAPFATHVFHASAVGNLIDSALVVEVGGESAINTNDNTPTLDAARELRRRHGRFRLAQLNYNAAGPYPSCFHNLTDVEKQAAHRHVLERNLAHMAAVTRILEPDYVMPFAGHYVLGGKQWTKNPVLGTTTWDVAAEYLGRHAPGSTPLVLREGLTFDLTLGELAGGHYEPMDVEAMSRYVATVLPSKSYPHEADGDEGAPGLLQWLREHLPAARAHLWSMQRKLGCAVPCHVYLRLPDEYFHFDMAHEAAELCPLSETLQEPALVCSMEYRLLKRIVNRQAHWNNAEIGCHIDFVRTPNTYLPDVHTMLSFFCLPNPGQ